MRPSHPHRTWKELAGPRGLTMVELIIIIVVIGIAFPTLISPFLTSVRGITQVENFSKMSYLAGQHMETTLSEKSSNWFDSLPASTPQTVTLDGTDFTLSRALTYVDSDLNSTGGTPSNYIRITVTVTDPDGNSVNLQSLITRRGT